MDTSYYQQSYAQVLVRLNDDDCDLHDDHHDVHGRLHVCLVHFDH